MRRVDSSCERFVKAAAAVLVALVMAACGETPRSSAAPTDVTAVTGPSWLARLRVPGDTSALGRVGGADGPAPTESVRMPRIRSHEGWANRLTRRLFGSAQLQAEVSQPVTLSGADVYRYECRSCHGPDGLGSPPEINSLIGPVQGTSAVLLERRLEARGRPVDDAFVREVVAGARRDLSARLANGGRRMPPFERLGRDERRVLLEYLAVLAGIPEAPASPSQARQSVARVGEHLVKGTCHICHDATGGPSGRMARMMRGITPSLQTVAAGYSVDDVIGKVREGSTGTMAMMRRASKMPRFTYLTPQEIAAAVSYLRAYPPMP